MKKLQIEIDSVTAKLVADMLEYSMVPQLKKAEEQDQFKDNGYLIKAAETMVAKLREGEGETK